MTSLFINEVGCSTFWLFMLSGSVCLVESNTSFFFVCDSLLELVDLKLKSWHIL
jgi:hypothetical protein